MQAAVRRHDELMRAEIAQHGGHVLRRSATRSALRSLERRAVAVLVAAKGASRSEDFSAVDGLRVRAAIRTGTPDERDGDYFGPSGEPVAHCWRSRTVRQIIAHLGMT